MDFKGTEVMDAFAQDFIGKVDSAENRRDDAVVVLSIEREFHAALVHASSLVTDQRRDSELFLKKALRKSRKKDKLKSKEKISLLLDAAKEYTDVRCKATEDLVQKCQGVILHAAEYADKKLNTSLTSSSQQVFTCLEPWKDGSSIVVVLSDVYEEARINQADQNLRSEWVAPSSFQRSTTKYWVKNEQINQVLFAAVAETPLLVYGKSGPLVSNDDCKDLFKREAGDQLWDVNTTPITSVYFDSPTLDLYKTRLARQEGSNLLRVRWYGEKRPVGSELLFLELKTHHEKWVNNSSVKERVTVQERDMVSILDVGTKKPWSRDYAKRIVLSGTPSVEGEELGNAIDLLLRIRDLITRLKLRACVRTNYQRAAFQSTKSNSLRLTLDRSVKLIDERTNLPIKSGKNQWCLTDEVIARGKCNMKIVPYAIFEIKLAGQDMPDRIRDLIEGQGMIVEAQKFSKYQTGAAAFNQEVISAFPYWASERSFGHLFGLHGGVQLEEDGSLTLSTKEPSTSETSVELFGVRKRESAHQRDKAMDGSMGSSVSSFWSQRRTSKPKKITPKQRVRVEPKSYFANERTFIQWISAALLLFTVSVILFDITMDHGVSHTAATCLICFGMFLACYALFTYYRRLRLLQSGSPYGYIDHVGPIIITVSMVLGLAIYLSEVALAPATAAVLHQDGRNCHRYDLTGTGLSSLAFEPSDLVYDNRNDQLLMVSFSQVTGIDVGMPGEPIESVFDLGMGVDAEGLTMVDDVLYVLSENLDKNSDLYAVQMPRVVLGSMQVIGKWEVPLQNTEAITYIPNSGSHGKLLIGSDKTIEAFEVPHLVNANVLEPLAPLRNVFNGRVVGYGTDDPKIGAMTFFEGVLYVLMDNARVIRGWDLQHGKILSQVNLPTVGGGFNRQWEGMALRRVSGSLDERRLRAGARGLESSSQLVLDLALDTPGQVWSFAVEETGLPGQFMMPSCAAASYTNVNATDLEIVAAFLNQ